MIMNGTDDPLVPFAGGEVNLLGLFYKGGNVRSSRESGQYFADRNQLTGTPDTKSTAVADGVSVEQVLWHKAAKNMAANSTAANNTDANDSGTRAEVELVAIHGGGHGLPQAYWRRPRLLGPSPMAPDGPAVIWAFFARQRP